MQELVKSLINFRRQVGKITKASKADRYWYADLQTILGVIDEPLADCGLEVWQDVDGDQMVTTVIHISGESFTSKVPLVMPEARGLNSAQALGSALSYARRYGILTALRLAAEDDDAKSVGQPRAQGHTDRVQGGRPGNAPKAAPQPQPQPPALLVELVNEHNIPHETVRQAVQAFGYRTASEIPEEKISVFVGQLLERHAATVPA